MNNLQKLLIPMKRSAIIFFAALLTSLSLSTLLASRPVYAGTAINADKLCIPPYIKSGNTYTPSGNWLDVEIINRSVIKINYNDNGQCQTPDQSLEFFSESSGGADAKDLIETSIRDEDTNDNTWDWRDRFSSDGANARLDRVDLNNSLLGTLRDTFGGNTKIVDTGGGSSLRSSFAPAELFISFDGKSVDSAVANLSPCGVFDNQNYVLRPNNNKLEWTCEDNISDSWTGLSVANSISGWSNFNITYIVAQNGDDLSIVPVELLALNPGGDGFDSVVSQAVLSQKSFVYCPATSNFKTNGCVGNGFTIETTPADLEANTTNANIRLEIIRDSDGTKSVVQVSGATAGVTVDAVVEAGNAGGTVTGSGLSEAPNCESNAGEFSFFLCPFLRFANDGIELLDNQIRSGLNVSNDYYEAPEVRAIWSRIRNIASILLIPILLIMVISTALGFSFVDAYTVKRAMPRLLAAVIFMALSYDIAVILIEITNNVGAGVEGIVAAPFGGKESLDLQDIFNPSGSNAATAFVGGPLGGLLLVGFGVVSAGILASYLGVALLALVIIFALIAVRELLIIGLMILGPLAILSWIFPGNDKMWKLWWGSFTKLLMIYPLVTGLLMTGRGFAKLVQEADGNGSFFNTMIKLTVYIAPFFFIIAAFKFAGGAFANLSGMINDRGKGLFDRQKKYRGEKRKENWENAKHMKRFANRGDSKLIRRLNKGLAYGSNLNKAGFKGIYDKETRRGRIMAGLDTHEKLSFAAVLEDKAFNTLGNNEDTGQMAVHGGGTVEGMIEYAMSEFAIDKDGNYLDEAGNIVDSKEKAARKFAYKRADAERLAYGMRDVIDEHGLQAVQMAQIVKAAGSKTGYKGGAGEMMNAIAQVSEGNMDFASQIYAKARGAAEQGGRMDLAGYSFGEGLNYLQQIAQAENGADQQEIMRKATADLTDRVLDSKGAGQLMTSHGTSMKNVADAMQRRVTRANNTFLEKQASGDAAGAEEAHRDLMFALAETANAYDTAAYSSPENGREFAEAVLDQRMTVNEVVTDADGNEVYETLPDGKRRVKMRASVKTVQDLMNSSAARADTTFQQRRREHGRSPEELAELQARGLTGERPDPTSLYK